MKIVCINTSPKWSFKPALEKEKRRPKMGDKENGDISRGTGILITFEQFHRTKNSQISRITSPPTVDKR